MSRPPHPHPPQTTGGAQAGDVRRLDYLPLRYAELLALEEELAVSRMGRAGSQDPGAAGADMARTFMELSALVGHVLAAYQRHYAGEAYISSAQAASSLVRHARRLAYEPDPGLAASGHAVLFVKEGVSGTVQAGLGLASVPLGEQEAQDYETHDDLAVDAALNAMEPVGASRPADVAPGSRQLRLAGTGHGLGPGDPVALVGGARWQGFVVLEAVEYADTDATVVTLDGTVDAPIDIDATPADPPRLLGRPTRTLRAFGSSADAHLFPPRAVRNAGADAEAPDRSWAGTSRAYGAAAEPHYWYAVQRADGGGYIAADIYLSEQVADPLLGAYVLRRDGSSSAVLRVTAEAVAAVALYRRAEDPIITHRVTVTEDDGTFTTQLAEVAGTQTSETHISATVTAIQVAGRQPPTTVARWAHPFPSDWLTGWTVEAPLAASEPNRVALAEPLVLPGQLAALTPGRALVLSDRAQSVAQVVTVRRAELDAQADVTRIWWDAVTDPPAGGWSLHDMTALGNVARVSHGRTVRETLGGSDGASVFQRFALRQSPVTVLAGVAGGEPQLEVRIDDVRWERVVDFALSGPDDRHYRSETGEDATTTVVFGDGRNGAVPPSGEKNVRATYRVGLGRAGDVEPQRLSRLVRAHPLLDRAVNLTPVHGGAERAGPDEIRAQATRWIRTFDRAVSVPDVADLALTMPGVARAAARWDQADGIVLVAATATGDPPPAPEALRAFLDARRDVGVPLELRAPRPRDLRIVVAVEPDPAFLVETVKKAVRAALHGTSEDAPGLFTFPARGLGQPAFRSEVYARLEALDGVVGVRVGRFEGLDGRPEPGEDVAGAAVDEWLRLLPHDLTLSVVGSPA